MFPNSQKESHHTGDNQQVIPGEDKAKDPGLFVPFPSDRVCQPKKHIMFLKTHKTASSTIGNILYRYGDARNLTFALPVQKISQFSYPKLFTTSFVEGVSSGVVEYDIICNHLRFNKPELEKLMPKDTFYFSIMRHPVTMFESSYMYYKSIQAFSSTGTVEDFLDRGWRKYNPSAANNQHARNNMAFDFGFNNNISPNATDLEEQARVAIVAIERDFHLILISEYFDESMVLLKHMMCWSLDDVVSFKLNSRSEQSRRTPLPHIADKILVWNALDWRLYVHFNATFWRKVDTMLGREEMSREVSRLRQLRTELQDVCLQDGAPVNPQQIKDKRLKPFQYGIAVIQGYNLKPDLDDQTKMKCQRLITPELQYSTYLYGKQYKH
ncbi:hypothetical protein CRUP_004349 [Coryphaenoides rupestris]|nr:hypothetical protein CRUP_004349 [Coryphaenoides rupestris]